MYMNHDPHVITNKRERLYSLFQESYTCLIQQKLEAWLYIFVYNEIEGFGKFLCLVASHHFFVTTF